jgi:hypothetical protein
VPPRQEAAGSAVVSHAENLLRCTVPALSQPMRSCESAGNCGYAPLKGIASHAKTTRRASAQNAIAQKGWPLRKHGLRKRGWRARGGKHLCLGELRRQGSKRGFRGRSPGVRARGRRWLPAKRKPKCSDFKENCRAKVLWRFESHRGEHNESMNYQGVGMRAKNPFKWKGH